MDNFNERPHKNERTDSIKYLRNLINDAKKNRNISINDIPKLEKIINIIDNKKYGLVWEEHSEKVEEEMKTKIPVFTEEKNKEINDDKESQNFNFLLEGDNLHSLHLLEKTHTGNVDVIYIDPPYNTGNKDFKYNDSFIDDSDSFKHSKWLSFMERRLTIAKKLLKKDGVIFVSIGDEEIAQLKLLMDEVFGENAFKENLMVEISATTGTKVSTAKRGGIVKNGEYVLVYSNSDLVSTNRKPLYEWVGGFDTHFSLFLKNDGTICRTVDVLKHDEAIIKEFNRIKKPKEQLSFKTFSKYFNQSEVFTDFAKNNVENIVRLRSEIPKIPDNVVKKLKEGKWLKYQSSKRKEPYYLTIDKGKVKNLATLKSNYHLSDDYEPIYGRSRIRGDYWKDFWIDMGNIGKEGGVSLKNGKKPIRLIKQLLKWSNRPYGTVLDFFAGSGTTGDATKELNAEDGGQRNFILATNDEVVDVAYQRMKNISNEHPLNLKYLKTDFVNKSEFPGSSLEDELMKYITPLVELEFGIDINNPKVQIILNEDQLDDLLENDEIMQDSVLFMNPDVFLDSKQLIKLSNLNVTTHDIPNYFFGKDMWS